MSNFEKPSSSSSLPLTSTTAVRDVDPLLKDLNEKKQSFRRNVVSLASELKELRSRLATQEQSYSKETLTRQEAETKAKSMELEIGRLQKNLEERNEKLQASASSAEKSGKKRLREVLKLHQLRPVPPEETGREFKFGDEVDAYHNDGWWEGHVTEECGNGRFAVYFRVSREQIVFQKDELRLHREWFNENWVPPFEKQQQQQEQEKVLLTPNVKSAETVMPDMKSAQTVTPNVKPGEIVNEEERFRVGTPVEVSSDEEGFQGAWFSATVVEVIRNGKFLVEYESLLADDNSQLLREEVDTHHIRPHPPQTVVNGHFSLLEEVDAFHNDGWWVGMVSEVLDNSRYIVYFRNSSEELEFQHSQLRKHQDWIDGKWIMPSKALEL